MSTYKESITSAMTELAKDPRVIFLGYGVTIGKAGGTLANVPESQLLETTVCENLMAGMAIGLSLMGRIPVVYFERFDFMLNAMDAIVNHLDKIETMSQGEFKPKVIFRVVVGNTTKPLFTGETHTQDFSSSIRGMVSFPVWQLEFFDAHEIGQVYKSAMETNRSVMIVEQKDKI